MRIPTRARLITALSSTALVGGMLAGMSGTTVQALPEPPPMSD